MSRLAVVAGACSLVALVACVDLVGDDPCVGAACATLEDESSPPPMPTSIALPDGCPCGAVATASQKVGRSCACTADGVDDTAPCRELSSARRLRDALTPENEDGPVFVDDVSATPWGWVVAGRSEVPCGDEHCETAFVASLPDDGPAAARRFATCSEADEACKFTPIALATQVVGDEVRLVVTGASSDDYLLRTCEAASDCRQGLACIDGACLPTDCDDDLLGNDEDEVDCGGSCAPCGLDHAGDDTQVRVSGYDGFILDAVVTESELWFERWPWCYQGNGSDRATDASFEPGGQEVVVVGKVSESHCVTPCGPVDTCPNAQDPTFVQDPTASCSLQASYTAPCDVGWNVADNQKQAIAVTHIPWGGAPECAVLVGTDGFAGELQDGAEAVAVEEGGVAWIAGFRWFDPNGEQPIPAGLATRRYASMLTRWDPVSDDVVCRLIDEVEGDGAFEALRGVALHRDEGNEVDEVIVVGDAQPHSGFGDSVTRSLPEGTDTGQDVFIAGVTPTDFGPGSALDWVRFYGSTGNDTAKALAVLGNRLVLVGQSPRRIFGEGGISLLPRGQAGFAVELARRDGAWEPSWLAVRDDDQGVENVGFTAAAWDEGERLAVAGFTFRRTSLVAPATDGTTCMSPGVICADDGETEEGFIAVLEAGGTDTRLSSCDLAMEGEGR